jgi:uncharacterized membrane protein
VRIVFWYSLAVLLSVAFLLHMTPRLTRPEVFFGVTVRADFRDSAAGRGLTRIFRTLIWALTAIAVVVTVLADGRGRNPAVTMGAGVWWLTVGGFFAWVMVHRMARRHAVRPSSHREAALSHEDVKLPGGWMLRSGPFVLLGAAALYLYLQYDALPDPFPVHWNIRGVADRFLPKSGARVFRPAAIGLMICATLAVTAWSLARHGKTISVRGSSAHRESRFRNMNLYVLLGAQYYIAGIFAWISVAFRTQDSMPFALYVLLAMSLLPLPIPLYLSLRYGQGGSRLADAPTATLGLSALAAESDDAPIGDHTPDEHWKWGQIYYNPDDAATWVEKRAGVGYTLNFAQPLAWILMLTIAFGPLVVVWLMR